METAKSYVVDGQVMSMKEMRLIVADVLEHCTNRMCGWVFYAHIIFQFGT